MQVQASGKALEAPGPAGPSLTFSPFLGLITSVPWPMLHPLPGTPPLSTPSFKASPAFPLQHLGWPLPPRHPQLEATPSWLSQALASSPRTQGGPDFTLHLLDPLSSQSSLTGGTVRFPSRGQGGVTLCIDRGKGAEDQREGTC